MRHQKSFFRRLGVLVCGAVAAAHLGASIVRASGAPTSLYYLQGNGLYRLALDDLQVALIFSFPREVRPADVRVAGDTVLWADKLARTPHFLSWNGKATSRVPLEPQSSADLANMAVDYDETGEISRLEPALEELYYDDLLLSPDGTRVAWNVNVVASVSPEQAVTAHQRHLLFWADIESQTRARSLAQDYSVGGIFADHGESRHLLQWSKVDPDWVFFTRFVEGQLQSEHVGLWRSNLGSGAVEAVDPSLDRVLALSDDERLVAHTPNDESCCGGINQTNNRVLVRDLRTGQETVVFDEWGEFANPVLEPGDEGVGDDFMPRGASFSPDGRSLAITLMRWSSVPDTPTRIMTIVRPIAAGGRGGYREERCALGWRDPRQALLGECRVSGGEVLVSGSVFGYDPDTKVETRLPVEDVTPVTALAGPPR